MFCDFSESCWYEDTLRAGSQRFGRLKTAVANGQLVPPVDMRYISKTHAAPDQSQRASVISFLSHLYSSVAETLPDFRDDIESATVDVELGSMDADHDEQDPYGRYLEEEKTKPAGSKERKMRGGLRINSARKAGGESGHEVRWLPPGQMKDMWEQYRVSVQSSSSRPASFTTFWRAS